MPDTPLTDGEMREYWEALDDRFGDSSAEDDPEGLRHSFDPRRPAWINRAYARLQRKSYEQLLALVDVPGPETRALDVGCGTGRWAKLLFDRGYAVTGIDIARKAIAGNRRRLPGIDWQCRSIEDFSPHERFALISCVSVISHLSLEEQRRAAVALRSFARPNAHLILLESIRYQSAAIHSRSVSGWADLFERAGFSMVAVRPASFLLGTRTVQRIFPSTRFRYGVRPSYLGGRVENEGRDTIWPAPHVRTVARAGGLALDLMTEAAFLALRKPLFATHAGMLFTAESTRPAQS